MAHDLIIRNGTVVDGTGAGEQSADIAIDGDRITAIGDLASASARRELDATGMVVSPGFIDAHAPRRAGRLGPDDDVELVARGDDGQICDADMSTHYVSYWHRTRGLVSLPEAVHRLSGLPAGVLGLVDRGTLQVGHHADINVFDLNELASEHPEYVNDFPNGAGRFRISSRGYAATIVNGVVVTEQGTNTGERPGRVIREFAGG